MPEQKLYQTSNNVKQNFRDYMRKYFRSESSFGMQYLKDIVLMLMNFPEVNILKKELGEDYDKTLEALKKYDSLYSYSNLINDNIMKMKEKATTDSQIFKRKIEQQNKELMKVAFNLPAIEFRIMKAFFILVNNCDLRNISVPKEERWEKGKLPSYLQDEKKSF